MAAVAGLLATVVADGVLTPIDSIKTRQQGSAGGTPLSFLAAATQLTQAGGVAGLWAGAYPFFLFNAVGGALKFGVYEPLRRRLSRLLPAQLANYLAAAVRAASTQPVSPAPPSLVSQPRQYAGKSTSLLLGTYPACAGTVRACM
jgi:hypothetical protein